MADLDTLRTAYRDSDPGDDSAHLSEERWELLAVDELSPWTAKRPSTTSSCVRGAQTHTKRSRFSDRKLPPSIHLHPPTMKACQRDQHHGEVCGAVWVFLPSPQPF